MPIITRTVLILSIVSLFADIASEMLYPVIPVYLTEIGFSVLWIGILEGIANFTAGISKGYFGKLSDEKGLRLPFVKTGYFFSTVSKPMMALFIYPLWILFAGLWTGWEKVFVLLHGMHCYPGKLPKKQREEYLGFTAAWTQLAPPSGLLLHYYIYI